MKPEQPFLFALRDLPPQGRDFEVDDPLVWQRSIDAYHVNCTLKGSPRLEINVLPVDKGWLLRGRLQAEVVVPCSRCCKDTPLVLDEKFEDYVPMPEDDEPLPETTFEEGDNHLVFEQGALMIDFASIAWEQFALALPTTPLCSPDCKGLCPHCGQDLNVGTCHCSEEQGDPRMAVLRGLTITRRKP